MNNQIRDPKSIVKNWHLKCRVEHYLIDHMNDIIKCVLWKCPVCRRKHNTKKEARNCMQKCREIMVEEFNKPKGKRE